MVYRVTTIEARHQDTELWMRFFEGYPEWEIAHRGIASLDTMLAWHEVYKTDANFPFAVAQTRPSRKALEAILELVAAPRARLIARAGSSLTVTNRDVWVASRFPTTNEGWLVDCAVGGAVDSTKLVTAARQHVTPEYATEISGHRFIKGSGSLPIAALVELFAILGVTSD